MLGDLLWRIGVAARIRGLLLKEAAYLSARGRMPRAIGFGRILRFPQVAEIPLRVSRFIAPQELLHLIDIGANTGEWAARFLESFPNSTAELWEPLPSLTRKIEDRFRGDARIRVIPAAASGENGRATITAPAHLAMASLHSYADFIATTDLHGTAQKINIETKRIDDVHRDVDNRKVVLKIDAQGHELEVLAGAVTTLAAVDVAIVEASLGRMFKDAVPTFAGVCGEMSRHGLMPCMFPSAGTMFGNHPVEQDIMFVRVTELDKLSDAVR